LPGASWRIAAGEKALSGLKVLPAAHFWNELLPEFSAWVLGVQIGELFILFCSCIPGKPLAAP
jgi:hypothetical protein